MESKNLTLRPMGWRRICKNTQCFGWELTDANEHVHTETKTTYKETVYSDRVEITPETTTSTTRRICLSFVRDRDDYENFESVERLEFFYNIVYVLRGIALFLTKALWILTFIVLMISEIAGGYGPNILGFAIAALVIWIGLRITENILASTAAKRLGLKN